MPNDCGDGHYPQFNTTDEKTLMELVHLFPKPICIGVLLPTYSTLPANIGCRIFSLKYCLIVSVAHEIMFQFLKENNTIKNYLLPSCIFTYTYLPYPKLSFDIPLSIVLSEQCQDFHRNMLPKIPLKSKTLQGKIACRLKIFTSLQVRSEIIGMSKA